MKKILVLILIFSSFLFAANKKTVVFKSLDNLPVTADLYMIDKDKSRPFIVLYHQAQSSRGEYSEIAQKLNALGYNCMAVDLRSGRHSNGIKNQTYLEALKRNKKTNFLKARLDIVAALHYARQYSNSLIAWGSSYTASLVLKTIGEKPRYSKAILAFSPGEYFKKYGKPDNYIAKSARKIRIPTFITSAGDEKLNWIKIYNAIPQKYRTSYLPQTQGNHGSSALWSQYKDSEEYWSAVESFLKSLKL